MAAPLCIIIASKSSTLLPICNIDNPLVECERMLIYIYSYTPVASHLHQTGRETRVHKTHSREQLLHNLTTKTVTYTSQTTCHTRNTICYTFGAKYPNGGFRANSWILLEFTGRSKLSKKCPQSFTSFRFEARISFNHGLDFPVK